MINETNICYDIKNLGYCTKGIDCTICEISNNIDKLKLKEDLILNTNAKAFIPKSRINQSDKLQLNLSAKEFIPKYINEDDIEPEYDNEEFDMIMKDIIDNQIIEEYESDESDEDKWYPMYESCECCKGFIYKCKGLACLNMGLCYCKIKEECDEDGQEI